jgi:hypothetical protein
MVHRDERSLQTGLTAGAVAAVVCGIFAWLGVVNGDEGWFALSGRLVSQGRLPYRDFSFTQGPAYAYLLAPFIRIAPSIYTSRAVSVALTAVSIGLLVATASRVGGKWAVRASCLALLATIPSLPYWLSITKTYALSGLFLSAILFTLTSRVRPTVRYPLAAALAVGLTEARTTGFALAVLLIIALLVMSPSTNTRVYVIVTCALVAFPFGVLVFVGWTGAHWGLFDYHQLGATGGGGIGQFFSRTWDALRAWPGPAVLGISALVVAVVNADLRARLRRRLDLAAYATGIIVFIVLHEATAHFFAEEYLAPVIAPIVVVSCVILVRAAAARRGEAASRRFTFAIGGVVALGIVVSAGTGGHNKNLGAPGWSGDPAALSSLTKCVQRNSAPTDEVFALSIPEIVVDSKRLPAPGATLGMFSYEDVSTRRARQLKILNEERIGNLFLNRPPKLAVLTVDDIFETHKAGFFSKRSVSNIPLYQAFLSYRAVCSATLVRPFANRNHKVKVTVYAHTGKRCDTPFCS